MNKSGQVGQNFGNVSRPIPFATYAGTPVVTVTAATFADLVLDLTTLCPGRFTAVPIVMAMSTHTAYVCMISAVSSTSVTIRVRHVDNTSMTAGPFGVHVLLTQMTPTSGPG
jgi:anti-sigma-K factor RskA